MADPRLAGTSIADSVIDVFGNTPIVRLNRMMEVEQIPSVLAMKMETTNPGGSAKDRPALEMILAAERPDDGVYGEEFGVTGDSTRQWIIDPIDGTANYLKGIPMWATLIALAVDGVPTVGVVAQPALGRRWWGATGHGAWTNSPAGDRRIRVSDVSDVSEASVSFQSIGQWRDYGRLDALERVTSAAWRDRGYGDAWPYMLLAEGRLECVAEFDVKRYDIAALIPIVREAGGEFTDIDGGDDLDALSSLATNGRLHRPFLDLIHDRLPETP